MDGDFLHLATALGPLWKDLKVNNKSGREGCWRKLELKGEEDFARNKIDINESDDDSDGESKMDELTRFQNLPK